MLHSCGYDQRVVDIPPKLYFSLTDEALNCYCVEGNNGSQISNPWYASFAESKGVILTPEQAEEITEQEYEEEESPINADLNIDSDYWDS